MSNVSRPMNKWVPITIIAVLVVALAVTATLLAVKISSLNSKLNDANAQVASLQGQVASLQSNVSSLQSQLTQAKSDATTLQTNLSSANAQVASLNGQVSSLQQTNSQQASQIETMSYPRNFTSIDELTNWLQKNNPINSSINPQTTPAVQLATMAFALQIKASRDGYLLPVVLPLLGNLNGLTNRAIVGNMIYDVRAYDNFVQPGGTVVPALPQYPIPPGS